MKYKILEGLPPAVVVLDIEKKNEEKNFWCCNVLNYFIVFKLSDEKSLRALEEEQLVRLIKAMDERAESLSFVPYGHEGLATTRRRYTFDKMLLLGVSPDELGLHIVYRLYQPITWHNVSIICSVGLSEMGKFQDEKRKLWSSLVNAWKKS